MPLFFVLTGQKTVLDTSEEVLCFCYDGKHLHLLSSSQDWTQMWKITALQWKDTQMCVFFCSELLGIFPGIILSKHCVLKIDQPITVCCESFGSALRRVKSLLWCDEYWGNLNTPTIPLNYK